jgi:hypothetical protein
LDVEQTRRQGATYAVPPMFEAYAIVQPPVPPDGSREWSWNEGLERHDAGGLGFARGRWVPVRGVTECCWRRNFGLG